MSLTIPTWNEALLVWRKVSAVLVCFSLAATVLRSQEATASLPQFTDVTESTGIRFQHQSAPEKKYIVESMSGGVLLVDYDRDGWLDIYLTNAPTVAMALAGKPARSALYRNNGDGTFIDVTEKAGVGNPGWAMGGAVGDYNNDGWPDMYVTCFGPNVLYRNNGDGTFSNVAKSAGVDDARWSAGAAFGDYDGDGWSDLLVSNYVDFRLDDLPEFGKGKTCQYRGLAVQCGPRGLRGAGDALYRNNGDGTFSEVAKTAGTSDPNGYYGMGVVWSDFNDDGKLDAFVANDATPNFLYRNDGNGRFTEMAFLAGVAVSEDGSEQACMGVAVGDYLRNGRLSIYVTNFSEEYNALYRNDGEMTFTDASYKSRTAATSLPYVGWGTAFFDFDNDGWLDLFAANGHVYPQVDTGDVGTRYRQAKLLFHNQRDGTFRDVSKVAGAALQSPRTSRGAAVGDLDNDGDVDVVVSDIDGAPMVLRNDGGNRNNWVQFQLLGAKNNRLALNARVRVYTADGAQLGEVRSGGSYLSQNDLRLHFGLGKNQSPTRVEILWPSGKKEVLNNLASNRFYTVQEGEGIVTPKVKK